LVQPGLHQLEQPSRPKQRERVLTADELRALWPHLSGAHGIVIKWLLWTGCRREEAVGMRWAEIEGGSWTIPAERSKNGRQRTIPLPRQALDALNALSRGQPNALVFPSKRGGLLSNWDRETKRLQAISGTANWHRHDLRRTVATMVGDLGFAPHVPRVVLGHAHIAEGATAVYARSRYQREHLEALQAVADELEVLTGESGALDQLKVPA
jgi:integrase